MGLALCLAASATLACTGGLDALKLGHLADPFPGRAGCPSMLGVQKKRT